MIICVLLSLWRESQITQIDGSKWVTHTTHNNELFSNSPATIQLRLHQHHDDKTFMIHQVSRSRAGTVFCFLIAEIIHEFVSWNLRRTSLHTVSTSSTAGEAFEQYRNAKLASDLANTYFDRLSQAKHGIWCVQQREREPISSRRSWTCMLKTMKIFLLQFRALFWYFDSENNTAKQLAELSLRAGLSHLTLECLYFYNNHFTSYRKPQASSYR